METPLPEPRLVATTVHGRYFARAPEGGGPWRWFVGFHGYAQEAGGFFRCLTGVPGASRWLVASVQALHPFYARRSTEIVANWMTRQDRIEAIADNIAYVDAVLDAIEREHGAPRALVFAGFSQGVAMAYRAAALGRRAADAVIAVAGDVPPELGSSGSNALGSNGSPEPGSSGSNALEGRTRRWPRVRIVAGDQDPAYSAEFEARDLARLEAAGATAECVRVPGGHEWTAEVSAAAGGVLADIGRDRSIS